MSCNYPRSAQVYQRAKWLLILCLFVVVFILGGGLGSLPEWLGFLRGRSAVEARREPAQMSKSSTKTTSDALITCTQYRRTIG